MHTIISSPTKTVTIGHDQPFCIIGERINPTGRKKFQEELRAGNLDTIKVDVEQQVAGGADVLDVEGRHAGADPAPLRPIAGDPVAALQVPAQPVGDPGGQPLGLVGPQIADVVHHHDPHRRHERCAVEVAAMTTKALRAGNKSGASGDVVLPVLIGRIAGEPARV